jgi:MYXO-CTERM domain-containing protein
MRIATRLAAAMCVAAQAAGAQPLSDRMVITTDASPTPIYDASVEHGPGAVAQSPLVFGRELQFPEALVLLPHFSIVVMNDEPAGLSPEYHRPTGFLCCDVSDLVIAFRDPFSGLPTVMFWSDEDEVDLNAVVALLDRNFDPPLQESLVRMTGQLQDLTALLGLSGSGYKVEVQSVVAAPEPGVAAMLLAGLGLLARHARRRRGRRQSAPSSRSWSSAR